MCGISGFFGKKNFNPKVIGRTLKLMSKRGPDSQNYVYRSFSKSSLYFLHSRLEIIDPNPRSNQPFLDNGVILIFNGEIYNYKELKNLLKKKYFFKTESDTEVFVKTYQEYGLKCFEYFEGMWSAAIFDTREKKLILSRDRFGEKPLHYLTNSKGIFFGSEVKFLSSLSQEKFSINYNLLRKYVRFGYKSLDLDNNSYFDKVNVLEPASNLIFNENFQFVKKKFWCPKYKPDEKMSFKESIEGARFSLENSLKIRLRSDKKIGFMLSGGIDSGYLVSLAKKKFQQPIETFSIIDDDVRYNEKNLIKKVEKNLSCKANYIRLNKSNFIKKLIKLINYHQSPISTISYYVHSFIPEKMKRKNIKVSISGTGADEIFTGYYEHFLLFLKSIYKTNYYNKNLLAWRKHIKPLIRNDFLKNENFISDEKVYKINEKISFIKKNSNVKNFKMKNYCESLLRNKMYNEMFHEVVPIILKHDDLNCMMNSIENRSPYLDKNLFEFMATVPNKYLINNGYQKLLLRESSKGILVDPIRLNRTKVGFNASIQSLINIKSKKFINKYILKNKFIDEIIDKQMLIDKILNSKETNEMSKTIFSIINVFHFLEAFD